MSSDRYLPTYAKFLKYLVTAKKRTNISKNVSSIILNKYLIKYKDPDAPTIACRIKYYSVGKALLDLGASINLMPYSTYLQMDVGDLKPTNVRIQLADVQ